MCYILSFQQKMSFTVILRFLTFIVGTIIPLLIALYSLGHKDQKLMRRSLVYFVAFWVLQIVLLFFEPFIFSLEAFFSFRSYHLGRFLLFAALVCPRLGALEHIEDVLTGLFEERRKAVTEVYEMCVGTTKRCIEAGLEALRSFQVKA